MFGARNFLNIYKCYCQGYFEKNIDFGKTVEFHLKCLVFQ